MGIDDGELDGGLFRAFKGPEDDSVLSAIGRLHGAGSSILLREGEDEDASPVVIQREDEGALDDDSRYQVLGEIARGGIGIVFKGRDKDLGRDIALKVLRPEYADRDDVVQRFVEEAQVGGQLQHPGIVPVYSIGLQPDGRPSFAMKLIKGRTLAELIDSNRRGIDLVAVFEQVAQTMAYAHSRGVIHRDLKPANVMVGAFGEVQVVDWGFAKILGQDEPKTRPGQTVIATVRSGPEGSQSMAGSVMGTPAYMPPEQALGQIDDLDEHADVFALGAVLCEILTGSAPYTGEPRDQLIAAAHGRTEKALARLGEAEAPDELKQLVRDCLEGIPGDRPANARVVAERISDHLVNVEERARQAELDALTAESEATRQQQGRRRALVRASVALLVVLVGGAGYFLWKSDRDAREARAAPLIAAALREATGYEGEGDLSAAVAAAKRAVDVASAEGVDDTRAREVHDRLVDVAEDEAFLAELEEIRARGNSGMALGDTTRSAETSEFEAVLASGGTARVDQGHRATDAAYAAAFLRRFGSIEAGAEPLRASPHAEAHAANLAYWSRLRKDHDHVEGTDWQAIDRLARRIDPDQADVRAAMLADTPDRLLAIVEERGDALPLALAAEVADTLSGFHLHEAAVAYLKRQSRRAPDDFWIHQYLSSAAYEARDFALAGEHATAALALRPTNAVAWGSLANAHTGNGDRASAVAVIRRCVELNPESASAYDNLGVVLMNAKDHEGSLEALRRSIELDPESAHTYYTLGGCLQRIGDFKSAVDAHGKAVALEPDSAQFRYSLGGALLASGDAPGAIAACRRAIELDPEDADAYVELGSVLDTTGDVEGATDAYERAIEVDPNRANAHNNLGVLLARKGDFEGAVAMYRMAVELRPDRVITLGNLASVLKETGDLEGAIEAIEKAIELEPEAADAHDFHGQILAALGDVEGAIAAFNRAIALDPEYAWAHHNLGSSLKQRGDLEDAIAAYRRAIELDPEIVSAHGHLGNLLRNAGDIEGARAEYEAIVALEPESATGHHGVGNTLRDSGDLDGAIAAFRRAIARDPELALAHLGLGNTFLLRGDALEAIPFLKQAIALDPEFADAHWSLGHTLVVLGDAEEAIPFLKQAIALDPELTVAYVSLGIALVASGDLDGAIKATRRALELNPAQPGVQFRLGVLLDRNGDSDSAIEAIQAALALDPRLPGAHYSLGVMLDEKGDVKGAIAAYRSATLVDPGDAFAFGNLGAALMFTGDVAGSMAASRRAIELDPDDPGGHTNLGLVLEVTGDYEGAVKSYERVLELAPGSSVKLERMIARARQSGALLASLLAGEAPSVPGQYIVPFADLALTYRKDYAGAVRLYVQAFESDPALVDDPGTGHRYKAARAAALAGEAFQSQAVAWLRADLEAWEHRLGESRKTIRRTLSKWKEDPDLASIRDGDDLSDDARQLWTDVDALIEKTKGGAK